MAKIVSAAICILLLVLVDKAAMEWKRFRGGHDESGRKPGSIHSVETRWIVSPQGAPSSNIVTDAVMETGKL